MGSSESPRLRIGVIGAGIAGLGAAIGLTRAGHDVVVSLHLQMARIGLPALASFLSFVLVEESKISRL